MKCKIICIFAYYSVALLVSICKYQRSKGLQAIDHNAVVPAFTSKCYRDLSARCLIFVKLNHNRTASIESYSSIHKWQKPRFKNIADILPLYRKRHQGASLIVFD